MCSLRVLLVSVLIVFATAKTISKVAKRQGTGETGESPPALDGDDKLTETTMKKLLSETNKYRLMHDATPLGNCPVCSEAAQKHVNEIASSGITKPDHKAKYGQIIFSSKEAQDTSQGADYFGTLVPARIYNQVKNYDWVKSEFKDNAADFTQLVWEGSEVVGFASKKAADGTVYVVMYFNPPGNNDTLSYYDNVNRVTGAGDIPDNGRMKCPEGWTLHNSNCYKFFDDEMAWPEAVDHCNVLKSSLVSAESVEEGSLIRNMLVEKEKPAWIGMSDTAAKGGFQFVDGTPYVYSDWSYDSYLWLYAHPGEARSKCITGSKEGWNYKDCTEKLSFICKMRPNGMTSYTLYVYFPGSSYTSDLQTPGTNRYDIMKSNIDKAFNTSYGQDIWFVGYTFYQFMERENGEVAALTKVDFAPDIRAPVDPITKLREYLRGQSDLKILAVRLNQGKGRVGQITITGGTCPSGCSGDCYPECNPVCCGAAVSLSAPAIPSGYTACPQYPACGTTCQSAGCSHSCCQQNPYQAPPPPACSQYPSCSATCAPTCSKTCCQQQQVSAMPMPSIPIMQPTCSQYPSCNPACAPQCSQSCCQQTRPMVPQQTCPQNPSCSPSCAPQCNPSCCQQQQQQQQQQQMMASRPMMMQPVMMQQIAPNACTSMYPGCSAACSPACRPTCCGAVLMGKKRSRVHKKNKKTKYH